MNWDGVVDGNLHRVALGNTLAGWMSAAAITAGIFLLTVTVRAFAISRLRTRAAQTETILDDILLVMLKATRKYFLLALALHFGTQGLDVHPKVDLLRHGIFNFLLFLQLGFWLTSALGFYGRYQVDRAMAADPGRATTMSTLVIVGDILIWVLMFLSLLQSYGKDVSALITGLGIGGIAVAFALQNILGDLFASFSIVLDKPFVIGDAIDVNGLGGTVEKIGLKTTRIRSNTGEQLVFSNSDLLKNVVKNFKRMNRRRVLFVVGVTYETPPAKLDRVRELLKGAVTAQAGVTLERCHLATLADSSLNFEVVYWVESSDYAQYVNAHHAILVRLLAAFASEKIDIAYPTRVTIHKNGDLAHGPELTPGT